MSLTNKVLAYQRAEYSWENLYIDIYKDCMAFFKSRSKEIATGHECFFYSLQRLERMAQNFNYTDKPFEYYLHKCLAWQERSLRRQEAMHYAHERETYITCLRVGIDAFANITYNSEIPEISIEPKNKQDTRHKSAKITTFYELSAKSKQLLLIGLRNFRAMENETWKLLADHISASYSWILKMVQKLHVITLERFEFRSQQHELKYSNRLLRCNPEQLKNSPSLKQIRLFPYHKDIAEILNIPKGTVDSTLHLCRSRAQKIYGQKLVKKI